MKARILLEVSYDPETCSCLREHEVQEALQAKADAFVLKGGLTPVISLAADCNLVVKEHTLKVEVEK